MNEADPLGVFLVKSGSKGDRLLFRYPFEEPRAEEIFCTKKPVVKDRADELSASEEAKPNEYEEPGLFSFNDKVLSNLFAVKPGLCGQQFELKIENVRFVGHPVHLSQVSTRELSTLTMFHIVFALKASASHSIVNSYYDLSHRLSVAVHYEEGRCSFLTTQVKLMQTAHDEVASLPEDSEESPFRLILSKSRLARDLKTLYDDLKNIGTVHLKVNDWIEVSFCLPYKVHHLYDERLNISPETIQSSLNALRPYHGMLLLVDPNELLASLPDDTPPPLVRLIKVSSPLKNFQHLAADADIILSNVFKLVGHLVSWCKATIIYPLCDSNVYVVSPHSPTNINSPLVEKFSERFTGRNLLSVLSQFSLPVSLSMLASPMNLPYQQTQQVQMVIWMLQHRLLVQLHTYVTVHAFLTNSNCERSPENGFQQASFSDGVQIAKEDYYHSEMAQLERNILKDSSSGTTSDDLKNFRRLVSYFDGQHHLEEIMYCENIRRSQLLKLIDKFREVLITYQFEDAAVAAFHNY